MGIDLRLLPVEHFGTMNGALWGFSHTVLNLPRNSEAWTAFRVLQQDLVPPNADISSFVGGRVSDGSALGEMMYGRLRDRDSYGEPYRWVTAGALSPILTRWFPGNPVAAYVNAMKDDQRVILDWH